MTPGVVLGVLVTGANEADREESALAGTGWSDPSDVRPRGLAAAIVNGPGPQRQV